MRKRVFVFLLLIFFVPLEAFAETYVTTNCNNVPVQESYNSTKVIALIPNLTIVTKINSLGEFYEISFNDIRGYINRAYTAEGFNEIENEKNSQSNSSEDYYSELGTISSNSTFSEIAAVRKKYVMAHNYYYDQAAPIVPADYTKTRAVDCSSFVSDVIYHYGKAKNWSGLMNIGRKSSHYFNGVGDTLVSGGTSNYFERIYSSSEARAGDILCYNGHVEIYAGSMKDGHPMVYNCGGNESIMGGIKTRSSYTPSSIQHILRVIYR